MLVGSFFATWYLGIRLATNRKKEVQGANKYFTNIIKCDDLFSSLFVCVHCLPVLALV
jgi:hypothetical protein